MKLIPALLIVLILTAAAVSQGKPAKSNKTRPDNNHSSRINSDATFNLADFGTVGDGIADDGPALQLALNALAAAGGGTLFVPAGRYAISTPVQKDFTGLADNVVIAGVGSSIPAPPPNSSGQVLTAGLGLVSEFAPRTGNQNVSILISGLQSLMIKDLTFIGTPDVNTDALITLSLNEIAAATIYHCEFYGLSSIFGAIVWANKCNFKIEQSVFLGCATSSGVYASVVQNNNWKGVTITDSVFVDYGQRAELYGKLGFATPFSWVNLGDANAVDSLSPRREAIIRNVFFDEGGFIGLSSRSVPPPRTGARIDLIYITGLFINVSNLNAWGNWILDPKALLIENSHYSWSHAAESAIYIQNVQNAILDQVECVASANRIRADAATGRLTVINSTYTDLASAAQETRVITTDLPADDPVQYVRQQFNTTLNGNPDPAAHYYWSNLILNCGDNASCVTSKRAALNTYLATSPATNFSIAGKVTDESGGGLAGATISLSGSQSVTTQSDSQGNYAFENLPTSGVYTVTASRNHYTFAVPSQTITTPNGDRVVNFAGVIARFQLSGRVLSASGQPLNDATVTLSGLESGTLVTGASGTYNFSVKAEGDYQINVTRPNYSFSSSVASYSNLSQNQVKDFVGTLLSYTLSGRITVASQPLSAVAITVTGTQTANTVSDLAGNYSVSLPAEGNYTVTATRANYAFSPPSASFSNLAGNQTKDFVGTLVNYTLSGRITAAGQPLSGVAINVTGTQTVNTVSDATGNYSVSVRAEGNYQVTATRANYTFSPPSASFSNLSANQTKDFVGTLVNYTLSGRITAAGQPLSGVAVNVTGTQTANTVSDAGGNYSVFVRAEGNYTLTATRANYTFSPPSASFSNLAGNQTKDFAGTLVNYTLSGRITAAGQPLSGVAVNVTGTQTANTVSDATGNYSVSVHAEGNYTVTATLANYAFSPPSVSFSNLSGNQTKDFVGTLVNYTLSGRITIAGQPLSGVAINVTGTQTVNTISDAAGNYSVSVTAEGNYQVTATRANYSFAPPVASFTNLASNQTKDFVGTLLNYTLSGRITVAGEPLSGVAINVTGTQTVNTVSDAAGNYSVSVVAEGNYQVTASRSNYSFSPPSASFSNLSGNQTRDFIGTLVSYLLSGRITVGGQPLSDVAINVAGTQTSNTLSDGEGNYSISLLAEGNYQVTAVRANYSFSPAVASFSNLSGNQTRDFIATLVNYTLSGRVTGDGKPLSGVVINVTGSQTVNTVSDAAGDYSIPLIAEGTYTIKASKESYFFSPEKTTVSNLSGNQTANFDGSTKAILSFAATSFNVGENGRTITITVTRDGNVAGESEVTYSAIDGSADQRSDVIPIIGHLVFAPGETQKSFDVFVINDSHVEGNENLTLQLRDPSDNSVLGNDSAILNINDDDTSATVTNPIDSAQFFVRQQYRDFLNRQADAEGLAFWSNQILSCGNDSACISDHRINVSAAFFLSIEFQETGFLVYRLYRGAYGQPPEHVDEFLLDTRTIGLGLVVNAPGWQELLEANKASLIEDFVHRPRFVEEYPLALTPFEFVSRLDAKAGGTLTAEEMSAAISEFGDATASDNAVARAHVLQRVAESAQFTSRELNPAFVLMQYFGYLQRNPADPPNTNLDGYYFWLNKLNEFGGDFRRADMVKSFLVSGEYRERFGNP